MNFTPGGILLVPIVFSDRSASKKRPVAVIYDGGDADLLVAPVTSQPVRSTRDVPVVNWQRAGLRLPSVIRLEKLATVEKSTVVKRMGQLTADDWNEIKIVLEQFFSEILDR